MPWVTEKPSEIVHRHVRVSSEPAQLPADPEQIAQVSDMMRAGELVLFSSDHPHDHGPGTEALLSVLGDGGREAVLRGNAAELLGLGDHAR